MNATLKIPKEIHINEAHSMFVGKTIEKMDTSSVNQVEFLFTDGTKVALHLESYSNGIAYALACKHCATIQ